MPYGCRRPEPLRAGATTRPSVSSVVPFVWRLSPLHPGYVMIVWVETREVRRERMGIALSGPDDRRSMVNCLDTG